ncbi:helix-turn-helix domain-containing protein [Ruegeria marina]|uniref:AraC-type DNA-binding protein n=1 Tax=Ruegeria marina TaxID=639004 RepID=A0A1G7EEW7_9RHOB|nr:AraC family transcriptional regulator [Ruegeria marina]SDE62173.1 AraC-type DNA-binding protein [Ruegeria marina]
MRPKVRHSIGLSNAKTEEISGKPAGLQKIVSFAEQLRGMPIGEGHLALLDAGAPSLFGKKFAGKMSSVSRMYLPGRFTGYTVPHREWLAWHIPLSWIGDYIFDGQEVKPGDAFITGEPNGYTAHGKGRDNLTIGVYRPALEEALRALSGQPDLRLDMKWLRFRPSRRLVSQALRLQSSLSQNDTKETADRVYKYHGTLDRDFVDVLAHEYFTTVGNAPRIHGARRRAFDIAAEARRLTFDTPDAPPSLSQLCSLLGVGETRLFEAFHEIHGLAPGECLMALRLGAAYERLTNPATPPRSVKEVALDAGFTKSGYFARKFQEQFGKLPSAVLAETRAVLRDTNFTCSAP